MFQSDTIGIELRNMVAICLNHQRDEGQISQIVYMRAVIKNTIIVDFDTKKAQTGQMGSTSFPVGAF